MMLVVEKLQNSIRSGKNSSLGGIRRSVVDYVMWRYHVDIAWTATHVTIIQYINLLPGKVIACFNFQFLIYFLVPIIG
jgi:hypothetical protein